MFFVKIHKSSRDVVAMCDSNLIGKTFEEDFTKDSQTLTKQLEVRETFFKDKEISGDEAIKLLKSQKAEDATFNIVGLNSVVAAKEAGIITDKHISEVGGIPFALVLG